MSIGLNWMLTNEYARTMECSDLFKSNAILRHQCSCIHLYLSHSNSLLLIVSFCSAIFAISFCLWFFFRNFHRLSLRWHRFIVGRRWCDWMMLFADYSCFAFGCWCIIECNLFGWKCDVSLLKTINHCVLRSL